MKKKYVKTYIDIYNFNIDVLLYSNGDPFDDGDIDIGEIGIEHPFQ